MPKTVKPVRCAVYTRKSTEEGLSQEFNPLDAQREAAEAYIHSQRGLIRGLINALINFFPLKTLGTT